MSRSYPFSLAPLLLLFACTSGKVSVDSAEPEADADTDTDTDADTDADTDGDTDLDGDGALAGTDCDDRDPDRFPGADEAWNEVDDDCDGVVDADGTWTGDIRLFASAVYEGQRYDFRLDCPFEGERTLGVFDWAITCTQDPGDEDAQRLLGATLTITPDDADVTGDTWSDTAVFTSSNGWDSNGEGTITWSDFDNAAVSVLQDGVSLQMSGDGDVER